MCQTLCYSLKDFRQNWLSEDHSQQERNREVEIWAPVGKKGNRLSSLSWQQLKWSCDPAETEQVSRFCFSFWSERHTTLWRKRQSGMKKETSFLLKMTLLMSFRFHHVNMMYCLLYCSVSQSVKHPDLTKISARNNRFNSTLNHVLFNLPNAFRPYTITQSIL